MATATATALPACSGTFERAHCRHPRLSYCGSSLEVTLQFDLDRPPGIHDHDHDQLLQPAAFDVANVFVFARFETADGAKPPTGAYSLRYLRSVSQSEVNPEASWIEGVQQTAAATQQHSQQLNPRQPTRTPALRASGGSEGLRTATFVLNGQAFAKWYYHWESGANKVQRATKHALRAYVFYRGPLSPQASSPQRSLEAPEEGRLELLCVVNSPPFTVVSYRRAPLDASASSSIGSPHTLGSSDLEATTMGPHYASETGQPVDSRLRRLVQHQISRAFQEYNQQQQQIGGSAALQDQFLSPVGVSRSRDERDDDDQDEFERYDRYRQLQQREGLRFRLLTPQDAARSGSALHDQVIPRESRLVFDSARRQRGRYRHWRDQCLQEDTLEDDEVHQDAMPLRWSTRRASSREMKATDPPPPSPMIRRRESDGTSRRSLMRFRLQQQQLMNHQRELQQLTDLAIVHFFVSHTAIKSFGSGSSLEETLSTAIAQHWQPADGGASHLTSLLLTMAGNGDADMDTTPSESRRRREDVLLILSEVCVWAFSTESLGLLQGLFTACHPLLLDDMEAGPNGVYSQQKPPGHGEGGLEFRLAFLNCAARCWSALETFLKSPRERQTSISSVRELSDAVMAVVYSDSTFQTLRSGLRAVLQRPTILLDENKKSWEADIDPKDVDLIQAEPSILPRESAWLRLICDGRVRVAPVAPNGLASLLGGASSDFGGDYVAYGPGQWTAVSSGTNTITSDVPRKATSKNSDGGAIRLEFYWWPDGHTEAEPEPEQLHAFRSVATLKAAASGAYLEAQMELERGVVEQMAIARAPSPSLELWSPTERVRAVASWQRWFSVQAIYARE
ncbi:hypothetical protein BBJ28_00012442 [Nothophytophthora sp. Chile5]|nr:hypothetical protein BBJ28_00012442 [Nothophytophthora sp. Chile5]